MGQEASEEQASRREGETPEREERADRVVPDETIPDAIPIVDVTQIRRADLTWLQYTRYRPPKLPRRSYVERRRIKRRTDDRPRIPFSSSQLQVLEDRYRKSAYLSRNDVVEMSAMLRLPQSKIKIWFQNRRARQRRESLNSTIVAR
ncbi:homeobox protein MSX-1 isoform X2 [Anoplolepis gracilipes]|uniref:homeobox protein MSX-1 isoform X2 n=1 Tax=Anoplolepis gracilipes TaxID=354296 RepID=UPI003BA12AD8